MPATLAIEVKETLEELKAAHSKASIHLRPRLKMLLTIAKGVTAVKDIAAKTGVSAESVRIWKNKYRIAGIEGLLHEGRGGDKRSGITEEQKQKIQAKLCTPRGAFRSYKEAQAWLQNELGIEKEYHALNKYLKRNWGTKLKVGRKSHVKKDEAAVAVFKKPARSR
jgi:transposase